MERPQRAFKLDVGQCPSAAIVTDASPKGKGASLLVNNKLVKALAFKVTKVDRCRAAQLRRQLAVFRIFGDRGDIGSPTGTEGVDNATQSLPARTSGAIRQHDCPGHEAEVEQPVAHTELHRGRDRDAVRSHWNRRPQSDSHPRGGELNS